MSTINTLLAATEPDLIAEGILAAVIQRTDMQLVGKRVLSVSEVSLALGRMDDATPCAVVLVGKSMNCDEYSLQWLRDYPVLVVARVSLAEDIVHIDASDVGLDTLLSAVYQLAQCHGNLHRERLVHLSLRCDPGSVGSEAMPEPRPRRERPLLAVALAWIHATMQRTVDSQSRAVDDIPGLSVTSETVRRMLDVPPREEGADGVSDGDAALVAALASADPKTEPLAALYRHLELDMLEWKLVLLALAPELDICYQKCVGFLLDDLGRRVGTLPLFAAMLGDPAAVRRQLAESGHLARWRLLDCGGTGVPGADEGIRIDPCVAEWLLGQAEALQRDPCLRRVLRNTSWPGAALLRRPLDQAQAMHLVGKLSPYTQGRWLILSGEDLAGWRALLELGAISQCMALTRLDMGRLALAERGEIEDAAVRAARFARLTGRPLVIDAAQAETQALDEDTLRALIAALAAAGQNAALIAVEPEDVFRVLGEQDAELVDRPDADPRARESIVLAAAHELGLTMDIEAAASIGMAFPLRVDGMDHATRLARARAGDDDTQKQLHDKLLAACRSTASQHISRLAHRIAPKFRLDDVILPGERRSQLDEIVANVRLASKVFDEWRFGEKLSYGRGVTVLFYGPSGTGKTMAAQAIAHELDIEIFALDLSRVVSKYIGETEKNIDAVFADAQRSGAAVLIDEADALLGKRSEVKDAHDRYANIEVAYLLQRMESFEGLAILTTNIRQNIDQAFQRRLRFVIEFPRPDARARAEIWRRCLPQAAHALSEREISLLAHKSDLTGGHIRQITLRAAFAAAAENALIGITHLNQAMNAELNKLGMPAVDLSLIGKAA